MQEHADYFKYSPTFALFMGSLAYLPDLLGLSMWNLLNCIVFYLAVKSLDFLPPKSEWFILLFVLLELVLSTQASQSNVLIAGLLILAFTCLEKGKPGTAALLLVAGTFIKIFAIVGVILFIFYPKKHLSFLFMLVWTVVFLTIPLVLISPTDLKVQYMNWLTLLKEDHSASLGMSVFTIVEVLVGLKNKGIILMTGVALLLIPLVKVSRYKDYTFRVWYLSAILIWIIIFNHKGESPTYIIAMAGIALWSVFLQKNIITKILLIATWILTSAVKTDLLPRAFKASLNMNFINALTPTLVFLIIIWCLLKPTKLFQPKLIS